MASCRPKTVRRFIVGLCALLMTASPLLASESMFSPAASNARAILGLFILLLCVCALILVIVEGLLLYNIFRFRAKRRSSKDEPPQVYGSAPLEIAWTVGPLLIVFVLFLVVIRVVAEIQKPPPTGNMLTVDVVAHQWFWEFRYPEYGFITANEMHVPVTTPKQEHAVYLTLRSADVMHSFWVPRLAGKTDVFPDRVNDMWFSVYDTGVYHGQCAGFCGTQHANMKIVVFAHPNEEFMAWVRNQQKPAVNDPAVRVGHERFMSLACMNCHTIRGTRAHGKVGPNLTHLMSRQTIGAMGIPNNRKDLTEWVYNAQQLKPGCRMPSLHLDERDVDQIVSYLLTLR